MDLRGLGKDRHTSNGQNIFEQPRQAVVVDDDITRKEDTNLKGYHEAIRAQISVNDFDLPLGPGYGDKGTPITVLANYLEVSMIDARQLFTYEAAIDERLHGKRQRSQFMEKALKSVPELSALGQGVATDYASLVATSAKLGLGSSETKTFAIEHYNTEFPEGRIHAKDRPFNLTLSLVGFILSSDLSRYILSNAADSIDQGAADMEAVRTLNVVMASHPNKDPNVYQGAQNKFFRYSIDQDTFNNYDLLGGLIAVRGYYSSIRFSTSRTLLNLNAQCSPFYKSINARELMQAFQKLVPGNWRALESFVEGLRVKTSYMRASDGNMIRRVKTISGLSHKMEQIRGSEKISGNAEMGHGNANEIRFKLNGHPLGIPISVREYFYTEYGLTLSYPKEFVLNCGTKDHPVWIPPELCTVMPGQAYRGQLNEVQLARMITIAARPPAENASRIMAEDGGLGLIGVLSSTGESQNLAAFGITVIPKMIAVPARVLTAPRVMYSGNSTARTVGGSWNMKDKKVLKPATLSNWTTLRIGAATGLKIPTFEQQCKALTAGFKSCGLKVNAPQVFPGPSIPALNATETEKFDDVLGLDLKLRKFFEGCKARKVSMLLVVLPSTTRWVRERVKFWGDKTYGIHTSCVQMNQLRKQDPNYSANVALKVNLKLGGTNQCISPSDLGFLRHGKTMLVGIDVTHPAPGSMRGTPSIAGVVASIDANFSQWPGDICCQESKKEMVSNLDTMMKERLEYWVSKNPGAKLENIVVYRDGVSEGQYPTVRRVEIPAIRKACAMVFEDAAQPKITFLVVGKNHHTRFYPTEKKQADQKHNCNIQNGTVVDRGITMPKGWDFYMAAHAALQGTTKPAHYVVLLDEIKDTKTLSANGLEQITHNFCYLQGRATKANSVCPPAYYAHLICLRARCYLADYINRNAGKDFDWNQAPWRSGVHESLKNTMFYI